MQESLALGIVYWTQCNPTLYLRMRTVRGSESPLQLRTRTVRGPNACGRGLSRTWNLWIRTPLTFTHESCAIAEVTARCAPYRYMSVLQIFGTPWSRLQLLFPKFSWYFVSDRHCEMWMCVTRSRGWGVQKLGSPWIRPHSLFGFPMGFCSHVFCECACQIWNP